MFLFLHLLLLVFTASQLQLKRMFKKDSVKKTEHLEVQGMELELTRHPLAVGGGASGAYPSCLWGKPVHLQPRHLLLCHYSGEL